MRLRTPIFATALALSTMLALASALALEIEQRGLSPTPRTAPLPHSTYPYHPRTNQYEPKLITPPKGNVKPDPSPGIDHSIWCVERYNTYRRSDNTYELPTGGRAPCISR